MNQSSNAHNTGERDTKPVSFLEKAFTVTDSREYALVNNLIVVLIFLSIFLMILESVESLAARFQLFFDVSEWIIVGLFTLEYIINVYYGKKTKGSRIKYAFSFWGIVDLFAILPTYMRIINLSALKAIRIFRILRFLRMLRVLKLAKHAADTAKKSMQKKYATLKYDLQIYFFALISVVIVFGTLVYFAENGKNEAFSNIPNSMWWCFVTITTVGYGDMFPETGMGRILAIPTMLSGLVLFGMLMNVVGKAMMDLLFGKKECDEEKTGKKEGEPVIVSDDPASDTGKIEITLVIDKENKEQAKKVLKSILDDLE